MASLQIKRKLTLSTSQCAIPVFDGLLKEPHNTIVLDLLFSLGNWHALAKLRLHTETSLRHLDSALVTLGIALRKFENMTCPVFDTRELPHDETVYRALTRGQPKKRQKAYASKGKKAVFTLNTYKLHRLGDYADAIRRIGTMDNSTTQIVSCFRHLRITI